jgi:uncharacterized protein (UPF0147 family)
VRVMAADVMLKERGAGMDIGTINKLLDEINEDRSVPKNIRKSVMEAKEHLNNDKNDMKVRVSTAVSILDEISNDPNIPTYTRTQIWNVVSMLEVLGNSQ